MPPIFNFSFFNKNKNELLSPMSGEIISISDIPDEAFSQKILGDGFGVIPSDGEIKSPVDGEISQIADTFHCWCIKSKDGLEILVHVGVDTVGLKGEGFKVFVKPGKKVKAGDLLGTVDLGLLKRKELPIESAVAVTNMNKIEEMTPIFSEDVIGGKTVALKYKLKK